MENMGAQNAGYYNYIENVGSFLKGDSIEHTDPPLDPPL